MNKYRNAGVPAFLRFKNERNNVMKPNDNTPKNVVRGRASVALLLVVALVLSICTVLCSCVPASSVSTPGGALTAITSKDHGASRPDDDDDDDDETTGTSNPGGTTKPGFTLPSFWTTGGITSTTVRPGVTGTATTSTTVGTTRPGTGSYTYPDLNDEFAVMRVRPGFENLDFGGETFTFAAPINELDGWSCYEVYAEEDGNGILDAAINLRNNLLFEHYDCFIEVEDINNGTLKNDFATGQNRIDIALYKYNVQTKATTEYYNFYDLGLDLTQPWWDQAYIRDNKVNGQIYTMLGAFSLTALDATWVMYFNKTVKETNDALRDEDFYQLVYNNEWTIDKFFDLSKKAMYDNGQTMILGTEDIFGLVSSSFGIRGLYFGAGQSYVNKKDTAHGTTTFSGAFTQAAIEATNKIIEIYHHDSTGLTNYVTVERQMRSNTVLFAPEVLCKASYYAGKQGSSTEALNIGILPHPKLSSEQANYQHWVEPHIIYMTVPTTCKDIDKIRDFLEVYAYHSYYTVYKQYLNLYKYQYTTDADSATMVETILNTRYFDMAYNHNYARIDNDYVEAVKNGENLIAELGGDYSDLIVQAANSYRDKIAQLEANK